MQSGMIVVLEQYASHVATGILLWDFIILNSGFPGLHVLHVTGCPLKHAEHFHPAVCASLKAQRDPKELRATDRFGKV